MALTTINSGGVKDDSIKNIDIKSDAAVEASKLDNPCQFADGHIVSFGTTGTGDLELYHSGSHGIFKNYTGNLYVYAKGTGNETGMVIVPDGEVQLMNDNIKTFETRSDGIKLTGANNSYAVLEFNADNGDDDADIWLQYAGSDGNMYWQSKESGSFVNKLVLKSDGKLGIGEAAPGRQLTVKNGAHFGFEGSNAGYPWLGDTPVVAISTDGNDGSATSYADKAILLVGRGGGGAAGTTYGGVGVTTELFRVDMGGNVTVKDGDLKIGTAGHGIDFSAQTATSATNATTGDEILDHYEEGTWTPVLKGGSANPTGYSFTQNRSTYTRIGRHVTVSTYVAWDGNGSGASGSALIGGLPYNVQSTQASYGGAAIGFIKLPANVLSTTTCVAGYPHSGADNLHMYRIPACTTAAEEGGAIDASNWFNSFAGYISFTMSYETA